MIGVPMPTTCMSLTWIAVSEWLSTPTPLHLCVVNRSLCAVRAMVPEASRLASITDRCDQAASGASGTSIAGTPQAADLGTTEERAGWSAITIVAVVIVAIALVGVAAYVMLFGAAASGLAKP